MISSLENKIYSFTSPNDKKATFDSFLEHLKINEPWDAILDLSSTKPENSFSLIQELEDHQQSVDRLLVIVVDKKYRSDYSSHLTVVPTEKEAIDYILFEQMQRDLGL